ncbi:S8 family serine peptidase [Halanaerobiaceae bacterium Z-7014]|uniref:S8 family serine peptidase n=1 Tax=Halonatronomonas betaini TaxID=2778430 RepID=A0A931F9M7_9FIRM|nr:S8 family serine peptidase [Halonatronomonas betaini]MBF8437743.1 S8 family serine peptidase [Halonatronomonas betaini]
MQKKPDKFIFSLLIILLVPVIITGCSGLRSSSSSSSTTEYSLRINEIEYNFYDYNNYKDYEKPNIKPDPGEIHKYESGTIVDLLIEPNDFLFLEWQGDTVSDNSILMDSPKIITPIFGLAPEDNKALVQGNIEIKHNFPYSKLEDESFYSTSSSSSTTASAEKLFSQSFSEEDEDIKELIIRFDNFIDIEQINEILADLNFEKIDQIPELNSVLVKIPDIALDKAIDMAENIRGIRYAEPNQKVRALSNYNYNGFENYLDIPDDSYYPEQWHYPLIRLPQAWSYYNSTSNTPIRIAVLDSGIPYDKDKDEIIHEDLNHISTKNSIHFYEDDDVEDDEEDSKKYNHNIDDDYNVQGQIGHGTHVTGTINAYTDNNTGVAGVSWKGTVEILPIKVLDDGGAGSDWTISKGLLYATGLTEEPNNPNPVNIINLSVGGSSPLSLTEDALKEIDRQNENVFIIASSGNRGGSSLLYPAAYEQVISVGSVSLNSNNEPERSSFSNRGSDLDFVAPGVDIYSTLPDNNYGKMDGTSMAAPHLTGLVGLMLSNGVRPGDVENILERTSMKINDESMYRDDETGYGLINAYWALNNVQEIRVILGKDDILEDEGGSIKINRNHDKIAAEKTIPLKEFYEMDKNKFNYLFNGIDPGDYILIGLIDVNNDHSTDTEIKIEPGDYFFTESLSLQADKHYEYKIELEEYDGF